MTSWKTKLELIAVGTSLMTLAFYTGSNYARIAHLEERVLQLEKLVITLAAERK